MVKVKTIGMIEHNAKSFPNVKAHADMINGALVGLEDNVTTAPASGKKLYIVLNEQTNDNEYAENFEIKKDEYVNLFDLSQWEGQMLNVTDTNIEYGKTENYASLTKGNTLTFDADTYKFKIGAPTAGDIGFEIVDKFGADVNGVVVKIVTKS